MLQQSKALSLFHLSAGLGKRIITRESAGSIGAKSAGRLARCELAIAAHQRIKPHGQKSPPFEKSLVPGRVKTMITQGNGGCKSREEVVED